MKIKLNELSLEHFKGIKHFDFRPDGKNSTIRGANATGKTTVADGFRWLLFGKDTQDSANFAIKTLDSSGKEISNLDHTVIGIIDLDGKPLELQKVYREKWTKKRGEARKSMTGHTTEYYIEGVPVQLKEWSERMDALIDEEAFKLVTLPTYFNALHWTKRREILMAICGDIPDDEIIAQDKALFELPGILGDHKFDDYRKMIQGQKRSINERLKEIPSRIDELVKSLPTEDRNRKAIEAMIAHLNHKIETARDDSELSGLRKELAEAQAKLAEARERHDKATRLVNKEIDSRVDIVRAKVRELKNLIFDNQASIDKSNRTITQNGKLMDILRTEYKALASQVPQYEEICPLCNQSLPQDQIEGAKAKFLQHQAEELGKINAQGKALKEEADSGKKGNEALLKVIKELSNQGEGLEKEIKETESKRGVTVIHPIFKRFIDEITSLETAIKNRPTHDISGLEEERRQEQAKLGALDAAEKTKERIEVLKTEEKDLSKKFEELERQLFLMEKFIVQKVNMLEESINSKFKIARFKLFDVQINEGIKETCVTTVNGVPYGSGLNKGMEIAVGLDIIKTLSEHYGVWAPLWLDNAEACTYPLDTQSQLFRLVVDPDYKEMKVSYE